MKKTTKSKSAKSSKKPAKTTIKTTSKRGRGRPKGSKNKVKRSSTASTNRPPQVVPTGAVSSVDGGVVVSHPSETPDSIVERSTVAGSRSHLN